MAGGYALYRILSSRVSVRSAAISPLSLWSRPSVLCVRHGWRLTPIASSRLCHLPSVPPAACKLPAARCQLPAAVNWSKRCAIQSLRAGPARRHADRWPL